MSFMMREVEPGKTWFIYSGNLRIGMVRKFDMFFADRAQHLKTLVMPVVESGGIVVSDRFISSTYVYQCVCKGFPIQHFAQLEQQVLDKWNPKIPIIEFVLDVDYNTASERMFHRGDLNRLDTSSKEEFELRRKAYVQKSKASKNSYIVDASVDPTKVVERILDLLDSRNGKGNNLE